jgi:hypothetical protein
VWGKRQPVVKRVPAKKDSVESVEIEGLPGATTLAGRYAEARGRGVGVVPGAGEGRKAPTLKIPDLGWGKVTDAQAKSTGTMNWLGNKNVGEIRKGRAIRKRDLGY